MKRSYIVHPGRMIRPSIENKLGKNWRNEYLFLQDNVPTHNATKIYKYLSKTGVRLMAFSPNSPEFNHSSSLVGTFCREEWMTLSFIRVNPQIYFKNLFVHRLEFYFTMYHRCPIQVLTRPSWKIFKIKLKVKLLHWNEFIFKIELVTHRVIKNQN